MVASFVRMATPRLERRVSRDFEESSARTVLLTLADLAETSTDTEFGTERIQGAIVLLAGGDLGRFHDACDLARADWRDLLVAAGLAHEDWPAKLDTELAT
jgi:hypothetical protein